MIEIWQVEDRAFKDNSQYKGDYHSMFCNQNSFLKDGEAL